MSKRYGPNKHSRIVVFLQNDVPTGFEWHGKTYRIADIVTTWVEVAPWWIASAIGKHVWRVEARRSEYVGVYELTCLASQWFVTRVFD